MTDKPTVSVVIPCLNRAHFLVPTIESVLNQSYTDIECIVVDGGSTDDTLTILKQYGSRLRWISEPDHGHADAINKGWRMSSGELIAWLNADDIWAVPHAVSQAVDYMQQHPEADVVYGDCGEIDENGKHVGMSYLHEWDLAYAVENCDHCIPQPSAFMKRTIVEKAGWLDTSFISKKDHELWLRLSLLGQIHHLPVMLASARSTPGYLAHRGHITARACVALTRKFFRLAGVPPELLLKKNRSMSNAHIRGMQYAWIDGRKWVTVFWFAILAISADWSNRWRAFSALITYTELSAKKRRAWGLVSRVLSSFAGVWSAPQKLRK